MINPFLEKEDLCKKLDANTPKLKVVKCLVECNVCDQNNENTALFDFLFMRSINILSIQVNQHCTQRILFSIL